jgi:hypothetical protein
VALCSLEFYLAKNALDFWVNTKSRIKVFSRPRGILQCCNPASNAHLRGEP